MGVEVIELQRHRPRPGTTALPGSGCGQPDTHGSRHRRNRRAREEGRRAHQLGRWCAGDHFRRQPRDLRAGPRRLLRGAGSARSASPHDGSASSNITGGGFEIMVADTDRTLRLYKDALGFDPQVGTTFDATKLLMDTAGTPGGQFKRSAATIPGTSVTMAFLEFKDIERKPVRTRFQDPGTPGSSTSCAGHRRGDESLEGRWRRDRHGRRRADRHRRPQTDCVQRSEQPDARNDPGVRRALSQPPPIRKNSLNKEKEIFRLNLVCRTPVCRG